MKLTDLRKVVGRYTYLTIKDVNLGVFYLTGSMCHGMKPDTEVEDDGRRAESFTTSYAFQVDECPAPRRDLPLLFHHLRQLN